MRTKGQGSQGYENLVRVVISIEPVRYATYVYLPMCSTRSGRPLLATSGPPSSLLLVLDLAPRVRLLSVAPYSLSFIMY